MKLSTKYFGEIEYETDDVIHFPRGLFAFEEEKRFLLLPFADSDGTLLCLQSTQTEELAFVVMNPFGLYSAYEPILQPGELRELTVEDSRQLSFYVLCVVKNPVADSTVNLKCPVAINDQKHLAMQVILEEDEYKMRHLLSEFGKKEDVSC